MYCKSCRKNLCKNCEEGLGLCDKCYEFWADAKVIDRENEEEGP